MLGCSPADCMLTPGGTIAKTDKETVSEAPHEIYTISIIWVGGQQSLPLAGHHWCHDLTPPLDVWPCCGWPHWSLAINIPQVGHVHIGTLIQHTEETGQSSPRPSLASPLNRQMHTPSEEGTHTPYRTTSMAGTGPHSQLTLLCHWNGPQDCSPPFPAHLVNTTHPRQACFVWNDSRACTSIAPLS